ncbi:cupin domain-containing protein [Paenibacillus gansuensis]|uniref:Cupin domain-containing protein n=1 Tax=Paenibacillus gansuensis TaxID=306542 RepID=A0ABW5PMY3_9BACL
MTNHQQVTSERQAIFHRNNEIEWLYFNHAPGEKFCIRVKGEDTNGAYSILDVVADYSSYGPPYGTPLHLHQRADEIFRIIEGNARFHLDGKEFDAGVGDIVVIPKNTIHAWANFSDTPLHMQITFTPAGDEHAFLDAAAGNHDADETATKHQIITVGPPLER